MDFGEALRHVKQGAKAQRVGWNGKGMHIAQFRVMKSLDNPDDHFPPVLSLFNAEGKQQLGWVPSQADMMAEDWEILSH